MKIIDFKIKGKQDYKLTELVKQHNLKSVDFRPSLDGVSVNVSMSLSDAQRLVDLEVAPNWLIDKIDEASFSAREVAL